MSKIQNGLIILFIFSLVACTIPETKVYTLYMPVEKKTVNAKTDASVAIHINSEQYLKQPYIAYRDSKYQIEISKYSKWESSPGKMVKNKAKEILSSTGIFKEVRTVNLTPKGFYSLMINLKSFERFDEQDDSFGMVVFDIELFSPDNKELYQSTVSKTIKLADRSFSSLAKGLSTALKEGIEEAGSNMFGVINRQSNK